MRDVVRPLGHIEKFSASRHALGVYRGIANACQYVVPVQALRSTPLDLETVVENALARLILRHGALRVGIIDEDTNNPYFVRIPSVNLHDVVEWTVAKHKAGTPDFDSELLGVMQNRLDQVWPDIHRLPPWKLIVVQHPRQHGVDDDIVVLDMVFAVHHAVSDGKSTALFHIDLLDELNSAREAPPALTNHVLRFEDGPVLAPSQEELVKINISWSFLLRTLWDEFGPGWPRKPAPWTGKDITLSPNRLNLRFMTVPSDVVPLILDACRSHRTTLTALLHALVLCSLAARAPAEAAATFRSSTAISLQPFAKLPVGIDLELPKTMTDMNTAMMHVFDPQVVTELREQGRGDSNTDGHDKMDLVWRSAEALRVEIKKRVDTLPNDDVAGMMAWVSDWRKRWLGMIGKPRGETWAVSNIGSNPYNKSSSSNGGNGDGDGHGSWRIQRSIFTQPALVVGPAFAVNVSGVDGGAITLTLNWQEGIVEDDLIDGVAGDLQSWLKHFEETGSFGIFTSTTRGS